VFDNRLLYFLSYLVMTVRVSQPNLEGRLIWISLSFFPLLFFFRFFFFPPLVFPTIVTYEDAECEPVLLISILVIPILPPSMLVHSLFLFLSLGCYSF